MQPPQPPNSRAQAMSIWTLEQARKAIPYIHSLMASLREHRLDELGYHLRSQQLLRGGDPRGRREGEYARAAAQLAEKSFQEDFEELQALSIYPLNAIQGVA